MRLELLHASVVVVAADHNPTILHPAFLASQEIVPHDWVEGDAPICTPAYSMVRYANGVTFTVENGRFVITEERPVGNPEESRIGELAVKYAKRLPHVHYKATGINFGGFCVCEEPEQFLIARFLREGPWNDALPPLKAWGSRFLYEVEDAVLRVSLDGGFINRAETPESAILVSGNFHAELPDEDVLNTLRERFRRWPERRDEFTGMCATILGL